MWTNRTGKAYVTRAGAGHRLVGITSQVNYGKIAVTSQRCLPERAFLTGVVSHASRMASFC